MKEGYIESLLDWDEEDIIITPYKRRIGMNDQRHQEVSSSLRTYLRKDGYWNGLPHMVHWSIIKEDDTCRSHDTKMMIDAIINDCGINIEELKEWALRSWITDRPVGMSVEQRLADLS